MEFSGMRAKDPEFYLRLKDSTYDAFKRVIAYALEHEVDFVCFSGDVYHKIHENLSAQAFFNEQALRLRERGIKVYMVGGNHDPISNKILPPPDNVHILATEKVERIAHEAEGERPAYTIYGRSYSRAEENSNFSLGFKRDESDENAIALLHTNVGTSGQGERYARASLADLKAAGMDYWALGHIHQKQILHKRQPMIVYPGSTQALHINEPGMHGCCLVEMNEGAVVRHEWLPTGIIAFAQIELDVSEIAEEDELAMRLFEQFRQKLDELDVSHEGEGLKGYLVRLTLIGTRQAMLAINSAELLATLSEYLNGSHANRVLLDSSLIDKTSQDYSSFMRDESNSFLRSIINYELDEERKGEIIEKALTEIPRAQSAELRKALEEDFESLVSVAKKRLYQALRKVQ